MSVPLRTFADYYSRAALTYTPSHARLVTDIIYSRRLFSHAPSRTLSDPGGADSLTHAPLHTPSHTTLTRPHILSQRLLQLTLAHPRRLKSLRTLLFEVRSPNPRTYQLGKVAHERSEHDGPRIYMPNSAQIHGSVTAMEPWGFRGTAERTWNRGRPVEPWSGTVDADAPWTRTARGPGRRADVDVVLQEQYTRSIISDQVVANYTLYSAPSDRRDMDLDAERTWTTHGRGRPLDVDVTWTWTSRGRGRPKKITDVDMPRTQTRHGRGLAADAGVSSMGFFSLSRV
jgi:hypothetical protein